MNAGMPTFYELTKHVVDSFDPPKDSTVESEFRLWIEDYESKQNRPKAPLDQIFHLLYQEYGREDVNALVAERLWRARAYDVKSKEHNIITKISTDQNGKPQVVTTNFDLLFEPDLICAEGKIYEPPAFPDINLGVPLTGITYLHGRLQNPDVKLHPYVLSSADFGRAYLSEGWATNFIRSLLKSYTVVLLGYQAEDPPVKYLLQGLNHNGLSDRSNLYAFDKGEPENIEAKWRDRGVTAIACKDYPSLWQSLEAWAERADNPRLWRSNVINLAMKGPRQLSAFERGQVIHLVRTTAGARLFAKANPLPPPEWLCVFDAWCRVGKVSKDYLDNGEIFDPLLEYGLDDDPPRPSDADKESNWVYDHILEWRRSDTNPSTFHRLGNRQIAGSESMPPRLLHLCNWITKHLDSPIAAWWAARQSGLHPRLMASIERELQRNLQFHPEARRTWSLIIKYQSDSRNFRWDSGWYDVKKRIKNEGWTPAVLRYFEEVTEPILSLEPPIGIKVSKPPFGSWEDSTTESFPRWTVKFPDRHSEELVVPDLVIGAVFRVAERHFHHAAGLLEDTNTLYFSAPTCYPDREVEGQNHERHEVFRWFLELFARMASNFPEITRGYVATWPREDRFYFRKLKLFALSHVELFEADEAAESLLNLSQECFWDMNVRRELLFLISDRWESFSVENKTALADRLLNGPDKEEHWSDEEYPTINNEIASQYTRWLVLQGKCLMENQTSRLEGMISRIPSWNDGWTSSLVKEHYGYVRRIGTDEAPATIIDLPVSEVVVRAKAEHGRDLDSFTNRQPFNGLVKANPRKALSSLSYVARSGEYPREFWSALIGDWPDGVPPRLFRVFLHRLGRLPYEAIRELRHSVGSWLRDKLLSAVVFEPELAWNTFDHLVSGLISEDGVATRSAIEEVRSGGTVIERSRRTMDYAINSPIGHAMQGLHNTLDSLKLNQEEGIPERFKFRIERLVAAPGEGKDHAVAILTRQIKWLLYLDPAWVRDRVVPWFDFDNYFSEPAWNGYLFAAELPPQEIGAALKPKLLYLFPALYRWSWGENLARIATQIIINLAVFRSDKPDGLNAKEARHCLRSMNDRTRQDAVWQLGNIGRTENNGWSKHVIPFINTVWPRERKFITSNLVFSWVSLLERTDERFPEVLRAVRRYLVPVERESHWLYNFGREASEEQLLTKKYPADVLELLDAVIPNSAEDIPYDLALVLDLIEETAPMLVSDRRFLRLVGLIEQT
ncbi:SIR2 family protein [Rheinheimera hassiensis]|uniref:SIR2 family protein n=1 Tax=Rheinheimera hassiensis TaxID=1193627 RepID=UPI001F05C941|nr:SIR2 family protein [Rheinheimera hassiensis]